jgi:hypothetical protein
VCVSVWLRWASRLIDTWPNRLNTCNGVQVYKDTTGYKQPDHDIEVAGYGTTSDVRTSSFHRPSPMDPQTTSKASQLVSRERSCDVLSRPLTAFNSHPSPTKPPIPDQTACSRLAHIFPSHVCNFQKNFGCRHCYLRENPKTIQRIISRKFVLRFSLLLSVCRILSLANVSSGVDLVSRVFVAVRWAHSRCETRAVLLFYCVRAEMW